MAARFVMRQPMRRAMIAAHCEAGAHRSSHKRALAA